MAPLQESRGRTYTRLRTLVLRAKKRVLAMVAQMDKEGFGNCTNLYECQAACPKGITVDYIAKMNREYLMATATYAEKVYGKD